MENRYEKGLNKLKEVDGKGGAEVIEFLKDIAPDLGKYIIEFAFGDIYTRPTFDLKQREIVTLSALTALGGCEKQLKVHINGALNVGISEKEIIEVFLQCIPYVGFPRVLNAVSVAKEIFLDN
ncbi:carboxymuconolactone decarboxylase family protein [Clostridium pasteurianum]|uniref:Uncharacterized protein, gamma-carboxymuconolactone decarboxylase subunit like protein n=1 Tax=Clostridium pasteurianum BC1 TaxID=86416 RepID=R4KDN1_CLOPA|nr:carboxymuconolactone decarboxylase family protein [Clostridium pasteurianum]AGK98629.1 uncharacterized protein, gamma-carboxymuconolactone decarboxylase subunit like protein [Clostridium pasteurianum BC1]